MGAHGETDNLGPELSRLCALVFYTIEAEMQHRLQAVLAELGQGRPWFTQQTVSVTWLRYGASLVNQGMARNP